MCNCSRSVRRPASLQARRRTKIGTAPFLHQCRSRFRFGDFASTEGSPIVNLHSRHERGRVPAGTGAGSTGNGFPREARVRSHRDISGWDIQIKRPPPIPGTKWPRPFRLARFRLCTFGTKESRFLPENRQIQSLYRRFPRVGFGLRGRAKL